MFTDQSSQSNQSNTSVFGLLGIAGVGLVCICCVGFFLGAVLTVGFIILYQLVALGWYLARYLYLSSYMGMEVRAARLVAGDQALPEAQLAPPQRVQWSASTAV